MQIIQIKPLKESVIANGPSSKVYETRDGEGTIRELKVDGTTPQTFRLSVDV